MPQDIVRISQMISCKWYNPLYFFLKVDNMFGDCCEIAFNKKIKER